MNKLAKLMESMTYEDLLLLQKDFERGNLHSILEKRIKERQANRITLCPVCSSPVKEGEGYHLQFGDPSLRKKATFDGIDCLQYFLTKIKK
ncbi:MAG: hypothetical protein KC535_03900 [Nanoarchaeota archaeon]|nr:hypothetical protein [Nanoarchaeota archaeon]